MLKKFLFILSFSFFLVSCKQTPDYEESVEDFELVSPNDIIEKKSNGDNFFLYIGRSTCPYCEIFAPKLKDASEDTESSIFYLNVENESQENLTSILNDTEVTYVPALVYFESSNHKSSLEDFTSEDIEVSEISNYLENP